MKFPSKALILIFLAFTSAMPVFGQSIHSNLKDPEHLKRHKHISESLMCTCGCRMILDHCNHSVCIAWTMRDVIDKLIIAGKTDQEIIDGFIYGFGESYHTDPAFEKARQNGDQNINKSFVEGFGEYHLSYPKDRHPELMIILFFVAGAGTALLFLRSRMRRLKKEPASEENSPENSEKKAEKEELYKHLYEDDND